jgi:hypothetical protein
MSPGPRGADEPSEALGQISTELQLRQQPVLSSALLGGDGDFLELGDVERQL